MVENEMKIAEKKRRYEKENQPRGQIAPAERRFSRGKNVSHA